MKLRGHLFILYGILEAILLFQHLSLLDHNLLLLQKFFLLEFGLFIDVILLHKVFDVHEAHGSFLLFAIEQKRLAEIVACLCKISSIEMIIKLVG